MAANQNCYASFRSCKVKMNYAMGGKSLPAAAEAAAADTKAEVWPCEHAVAHAWTTCIGGFATVSVAGLGSHQSPT